MKDERVCNKIEINVKKLPNPLLRFFFVFPYLCIQSYIKTMS